MATVKALVIWGGGGWGGGYNTGVKEWGGGGGAGGYQYNASLTVTPQAYSITIGTGGVWWGTSADGTVGNNSTFSTITWNGGWFGARASTSSVVNWWNGWSWGWWTWQSWNTGAGGTASQWFAGGASNTGRRWVGWGWWSSSVGQDGQFSTNSGNGGSGTSNSISGSAVIYAGWWGWWTSEFTTNGTGGSGGGWAGWVGLSNDWTAGTANTWGGGGWGGWSWSGGNWWSGVVIISYASDGSDGVSTSSTGGSITNSGWQTIHTFTSNWTFTMVASTGSSNSGFFMLIG